MSLIRDRDALLRGQARAAPMARLKCSMRTAVFLTSEEYTSEPPWGRRAPSCPAPAICPAPALSSLFLERLQHCKSCCQTATGIDTMTSAYAGRQDEDKS